MLEMLCCSQIHFVPCDSGVCGCCGALRPRYKRLVDNIFPEDPEVRSDTIKALSMKKGWFIGFHWLSIIRDQCSDVDIGFQC